MCSDGILESVSDEFIQKNFIIEKKTEQIIAQISDLCASNSSDNYTCVIAQCEKTEIETPKPTPVIVHQSSSPKELKKVQDSGSKNKKYNAATFWILGILIVAAVSVYFVKFKPGKKNDANPVEVKTTDPAQPKTTVPPVDDKPATNKEQPSKENDDNKPISQPTSSASKSTSTIVSNQATDKTIDKEKANSQEATSPKTAIVTQGNANSSTPVSTDKSTQNNSDGTKPNDPASKPEVNNSLKNLNTLKPLTRAELDSIKRIIDQKQPSCDEMRKWNEKILHVPKYQSQTKAITRFKELFKKCG